MSEPKKKKRAKKPVRYVLASFGCPPMDHTERVKVIESRMCQALFEEVYMRHTRHTNLPLKGSVQEKSDEHDAGNTA